MLQVGVCGENHVVESVALSSVLPGFAVSLPFSAGCGRVRLWQGKGGLRDNLGVLFCLVLTVVLGRLVTQVYHSC